MSGGVSSSRESIISFAGKTDADALSNSEGKTTSRLKFKGLDDSIYKVAYSSFSGIKGTILQKTGKYKKMEVEGKTVLVNINSVVNRLGISKQKLKESSDVRLVIEQRVEELTQNEGKEEKLFRGRLKEGFTTKQIDIINSLKEKVKNQEYTHLSRKEHKELPFSVTVTKEGSTSSTYVHMRTAGEGASKVAKIIVNWEKVSGDVGLLREVRLLPRTKEYNIDGEKQELEPGELDKNIKNVENEKAIRNKLGEHLGIISHRMCVDIKKHKKGTPKEGTQKEGMIQEYLPFDLKQLSGLNSKVKFGTKLKMMSQVAGGIAHMHKKDCAHLDLKLQNLRGDPEKAQAKAGDFDLSLSTASADNKANFSDYHRRGTKAYFSPETQEFVNIAYISPADMIRKVKNMITDIEKQKNEISRSDGLDQETIKTLNGELERCKRALENISVSAGKANRATPPKELLDLTDNLRCLEHELDIAKDRVGKIKNPSTSEEAKQQAISELSNLTKTRVEKIDSYGFGKCLERFFYGKIDVRRIQSVEYDGKGFNLDEKNLPPQVQAVKDLNVLIRELKDQDPSKRPTIKEAQDRIDEISKTSGLDKVSPQIGRIGASTHR